MGNEDNRTPGITQVLQLDKEFLCLLRCQDSGRFIKDQDLTALDQGFDDLDFLLDTDGQILDVRFRVDIKAVFFTAFRSHADCLVHIKDKSVGRFNSQCYIFRDGQRRNLHEVLMDHADAGPDRVSRGIQMHLIPLDDDPAFIRLLNAEKHLHQCRLAGPVLAADGVDFTLSRGKIYFIIGDDTIVVDFGNILHHKIIFHKCAPLSKVAFGTRPKATSVPFES